MTKITSGGIDTYFGFSDDTLPTPVPEGTLYIFLDKPQIWIARANVWAFLMPIDYSVAVPYGGIPDSVQISSSGGGIASRQVVALGSNISGQLFSGVEAALERLIDLNLALLTEMRTQTMLLAQGLSGFPLTDDLDALRAAALVNEETITR